MVKWQGEYKLKWLGYCPPLDIAVNLRVDFFINYCFKALYRLKRMCVLAFLALWERCRKAERVNNFAGNLRVAYHLTLSLSSDCELVIPPDTISFFLQKTIFRV